MKRTSCVVCKHSPLNPLFIEKTYPVILAPSLLPPESDRFSDYCLEQCNRCKCIQSVNLIDPGILYENNHNITYNTPTWKAHHSQFCEFLCDENEKQTIVEVGGFPGILASQVIEKLPIVKYTLMDLCDKKDSLSSAIHFIKGNCEDFDYNGYDTIVMSHIFEHLYNPPLELLKKLPNQG